MPELVDHRPAQVCHRIGVVGEQGPLGRYGGEQAVALLDQMAQRQHAQADMDGIVAVAARHVELGAAAPRNAAISLPARTLSSNSSIGASASSSTVAISDTGSTGTRRGDLLHHVGGQPADDLEAALLVEAAQVAAGVARIGRQPVARRHQTAEVHAGIAEAVPAAASASGRAGRARSAASVRVANQTLRRGASRSSERSSVRSSSTRS